MSIKLNLINNSHDADKPLYQFKLVNIVKA